MEKQYTQEALQLMNKKAFTKDYHGLELKYKAIPETDVPGAMDPRVLKASKKMSLMMKLIPKSKKANMFADLEGLRKMFAGVKSIPVTDPNMKIDELEADGVPIRIYHPKAGGKELPVLYYIHGGGFFGGSMDVVHEACKMITDMMPCITVSVSYRLAPENPFPAGHEDCYTALKWIHKNIEAHGGNKEKIAVSGDSAGGNLCVYCGYRDTKEKTGMVKAIIPYYPTVNMCGKKDDIFTNDPNEIEVYDKHKKYVLGMLSMMGSMSNLGDMLGVKDASIPELSPYQADVTGFPPTLLMVGQHDFLFLETIAFGVKLKNAGVKVEAIIYCGMGHAFLDQVGVAPQAEDSLMEVKRFMMENL